MSGYHIYNPFEKNRGGLDSAKLCSEQYFASLGIETWVLTLGAVGKIQLPLLTE